MNGQDGWIVENRQTYIQIDGQTEIERIEKQTTDGRQRWMAGQMDGEIDAQTAIKRLRERWINRQTGRETERQRKRLMDR